MQASRKHINSTLSSIESLKSRYKYLEKDISHISSPHEYEQTIKHFDTLINELKKQLVNLPIGHSYKGTFYIKKAYTNPISFEKYDGELYMREDLITWEVRITGSRNSFYTRSAFKEPQGSELKREDAVPVFAKEKI